MDNLYIDETSDATRFLVVLAIIVIILSAFIMRQENFVPENKNFDEVMEEKAPDIKSKLKKIRLRRQEAENQLNEIDDRLYEIRETALGGHSSAYFTSELNELSMKRIPIANKLEMIKAEELKTGSGAANFVKNILNKEFMEKYQ